MEWLAWFVTGFITLAFWQWLTRIREKVALPSGEEWHIEWLLWLGAMFLRGTSFLRNLVTPNCTLPLPPDTWQKDIVYLYIFPRKWTKQVVNLSPFAIKLETWLRLHHILYEVVETRKFSPRRRQIPYVWFNGAWLEDSEYIIQELQRHYALEEDEGLDARQLAVSHAISRMIETNTSWTVFVHRYVFKSKEFSKIFQIGSYGTEKVIGKIVVRYFLQKGFAEAAVMVGIGRNSEERVGQIGQADVKALSKQLGDQKFLTGDRITYVDCCVFGQLSQVAFAQDMDYPHKRSLESDCDNVQQYLFRIRQALWPDWDKLCDATGTFW